MHVSDKLLRTVEEHWLVMEAMTMPADAGATQRRDIRRTFYSGVAAAWQLFMQVKGMTPEAGERHITQLGDELRAYGEQVLRERQARDGRARVPGDTGT